MLQKMEEISFKYVYWQIYPEKQQVYTELAQRP